MRRIPEPALNDPQVFDSIVAAKQQPRRAHLQAIRATVVAAYGDYSHAAPNLETLLPVVLTDDQREALIHSYKVPTAPLARMRESLLGSVNAARCPFCGLNETSTIDHYLPKEQHPQFAVLSKNLVPSCAPCNTRKNELLIDEATNVRLFLHPYFDTIPGGHFVTAAISIEPQILKLSFEIVRPNGMAQQTFQHLESHFNLLNLGNRYRRMSLEHLRSQYPALARFYGPNSDWERVASELGHSADDFVAVYGANHWRAVLYRTLAADHDFCDGGFEILKSIQ